MYAFAPGVAERFDLFGFAGDVVCPAVLHVAARGGPLEVAVEFDAIRRINVDALDLSSQPLSLRQPRHHLQAVAKDHAVTPVRGVLAELRPGLPIMHAVSLRQL